MTDVTDQPALSSDMPPEKAKKPRKASARPKAPRLPNAAIATGIHPTTRLPLLEEQSSDYGARTRCGSCVHNHLAYEGRFRGLDVQASACDLTTTSIEADPQWPACIKHQPRDP